MGQVARITKEQPITDMDKIIMIADLHITPDGGHNPNDSLSRLHAATNDINQNHPDANAVVVLGDIAHRGDSQSYNLAKDAFTKLLMPVYLLPGNHDNRDNLRNAFPNLPSGFIQQTFSVPAGNFVLTDSVRQGKVSGEYCPLRAQWLKNILQHAKHPVFVCMHHTPLLVPFMQDADFVSEYFRPLADVVDEFPGMIRHFVFGHLHASANGVWRGIPFSLLRSFQYQTLLTHHIPNGGEKYVYTNALPHYGILLADKNTTVFHHHSFLENFPAQNSNTPL